ncbi:MAG TPA: hypothetical protein VF610_12720, partial [Segetibacter sp.]
MLGVKLNGVFLDLKPRTSTEIDRKSPLFAISEYASEGTTEPVVFRYSPKNALAFDLPFQYYSERRKKKYQVEYYSGNSFLYRCTLVIETGKLNLNNIQDTEISGVLLYSISDFFQNVKGKKLSDLQLGGVRTFAWTTNIPGDGSAGFWQHVHASWTDDDIPYVFQPIRNDAYYGKNGDVDWMNKLNDNAQILYDLQAPQPSPLVPMIKLKYLITQIFEEAGFAIDFTGLNDEDWKKLLLVNLKRIDWWEPKPLTDADGNTVIQRAPSSIIKIDLKKHVPQDKTVSDFILQLFFRYGWTPLFNSSTKKCRLVAVKEYENGRIKDWTKYTSPRIESAFNEDIKIFAFTNEIDSNDELPSAPDLTNANTSPGALAARNLPVPTSAQAGLVTFCYHDNQWWQVQLDETTNEYAWKLLGDNIYNDEPKDNNETIATTISTLPSYYTEYRKVDNIAYGGYFPAMSHEATKNI